MKLEHYLKRVEESSEYQSFIQENPEAYLCAGFFVLDFEDGKNIYQIDYYLPHSKKIATFTLDKGVSIKLSEPLKGKFKNKKLEKLRGEIKTDLEALQGIVQDEMKNRNITQELKKIIAVLQNQEEKNIWILNCITAGLGILKVHIDDDTSSILEFEKANLFDLLRKV